MLVQTKMRRDRGWLDEKWSTCSAVPILHYEKPSTRVKTLFRILQKTGNKKHKTGPSGPLVWGWSLLRTGADSSGFFRLCGAENLHQRNETPLWFCNLITYASAVVTLTIIWRNGKQRITVFLRLSGLSFHCALLRNCWLIGFVMLD